MIARGRTAGRRLAARRLVCALAVGVTMALAPSWWLAQAADCDRWRTAAGSMGTAAITIEAGARSIPLQVRLADTSERQAAGFQCATVREIDTTLILFDFGREILTRFHMQNVAAPLDIAFVKADGRIFWVMKMDPSPTALYGPMGPFRWALEARAGFFEAHGIRAGSARLVGDRRDPARTP